MLGNRVSSFQVGDGTMETEGLLSGRSAGLQGEQWICLWWLTMLKKSEIIISNTMSEEN